MSDTIGHACFVYRPSRTPSSVQDCKELVVAHIVVVVTARVVYPVSLLVQIVVAGSVVFEAGT